MKDLGDDFGRMMPLTPKRQLARYEQHRNVDTSHERSSNIRHKCLLLLFLLLISTFAIMID